MSERPSDTNLPRTAPRIGRWPRPRRPRRPLLPQVLELLAIIAFLLISYHGLMWYWEWGAPRVVKVPELVGLTEREAQSVLAALGLRGEVVATKPDDKAAEGTVVTAEPPPAREVKAGRLVRLTLSSGSRWSLVPDVGEMAVDRARALVRAAGLSAGKESAVYDSKVPIGYVVAQQPKARARVARGSEVALSVSNGPPPTSSGEEPSGQEEGVRSTEVDFVVPPGAGLQEVKIVVKDQDGERTVYNQAHQRGERVTRTVSGKGARISVQVLLSGEVMQEKTF